MSQVKSLVFLYYLTLTLWTLIIVPIYLTYGNSYNYLENNVNVNEDYYEFWFKESSVIFIFITYLLNPFGL